MAAAAIVAILLAGGTYMMLRRGMLRIAVGFVIVAHAVNLLLVLSGGPDRRRPPIGDSLQPHQVADPLPQALVLTAVVISFAVTIYLLVLAVIGEGDDDTSIDLTDREMETPDLIEANPGVRRHSHRYPHSDWHSYLDRTDDVDENDEPTAGGTS